MGYQLVPLICVCVACFATSYTTAYIFSYVAYLAVYLSSISGSKGTIENPDQAGYLAGYISGAMFLGRMFSSPFWGYLADKYGRRPMMIFSSISNIVFPLLFGFSRNIYFAIMCRFCLGLGNGTVAIAKTMISELTTDEHSAMGMSAYTATWAIGLIVGPAVSGWTALFDSSNSQGSVMQFTDKDAGKFLLPSLIASGLSCIGLIFTLLFLPETLETKKILFQKLKTKEEYVETEIKNNGKSDAPVESEIGKNGKIDANELPVENELDSNGQVNGNGYKKISVRNGIEKEPLVDPENGSIGENSETVVENRNILFQEKFISVLMVYAGFSFCTMYNNDVLPLWAVASLEKGGLSFGTADVGTLLAIAGVFMLFSTLFIYPRLSRRLSFTTMFVLGSVCWASLLLFMTLISHLLMKWTHNKSLVFGVLTVFNGLREMSELTAFNSLFILTNNSVPSEVRGRANGISMGVASLTKMLGPTIGAVLFAWSIDDSKHTVEISPRYFSVVIAKPYFPFDWHFAFLLDASIVLSMAALAYWRIPRSTNSAFVSS